MIEETKIVTQIQEKTTSALKYSILVTAVIILILMLITTICIFRCVASSRQSVQAAMKAHQIAELERQVGSDRSQFKPEGNDAKQLYSQRSLSRSQKSKAKGKAMDVDAVSNAESMRDHKSMRGSVRDNEVDTVQRMHDSESKRIEFTVEKRFEKDDFRQTNSLKRRAEIDIKVHQEEYDDGFNSTSKFNDSRQALKLNNDSVKMSNESPKKTPEEK